MSIKHVTSPVEHIKFSCRGRQSAKCGGHQGWFWNEPSNLADAVGLGGGRNERDFVISKVPSRSKSACIHSSRSVELVRRCEGRVIPAHVCRKPGQTRDDLFKINAGIAKEALNVTVT